MVRGLSKLRQLPVPQWVRKTVLPRFYAKRARHLKCNPVGPSTPFPTAAINPGSAWTTRATWEEASIFVLGLNAVGMSYDKRGQGASTGSCCPTDAAELFDLLADDLVAAVRALKEIPEVDTSRLGLFGSSMGGWIAPLAANRARDDVAFTLVTVGGAVSTGQEGLYDTLTGYDVCERTSTSISQITDQLRAAGPSGFDPRESIEQLAQPGMWVYGAQDFSHPTDLAVSILEAIETSLQKDWTIVVFPTGNHDLIDNGSICQTEGPLVDVVTPMAEWFSTL